MKTGRRQRTEISEKDFQAQVVQYAKLRGWMTFHDFDSRKSTPGFPDLVMARAKRTVDGFDGQLIFVELKSETGRVRANQWTWLNLLGRVPHIGVYLWRPSDWKQIQEVLK